MKHEVLGKAHQIALDRLHKHLGGHSVELGQIGIKHHALLAQCEDAAADEGLQGGHCWRLGCLWIHEVPLSDRQASQALRRPATLFRGTSPHPTAACAAANLAIGTRNGEQLT